MSQWAYIVDDAGDLVNLHKMESIAVFKLEHEQLAEEGHTHEVLALNGKAESYRMTSGTEEECRKYLRGVAEHLAIDLRLL